MASEPQAVDLMIQSNIIQDYTRLLREAFDASEAVDKFDLTSEDSESRKKWSHLVIESARAQMNLIEFVQSSGAMLSFQLGSAMIDDIYES